MEQKNQNLKPRKDVEKHLKKDLKSPVRDKMIKEGRVITK